MFDRMLQTTISPQHETIQNISDTFTHWSEEYSLGVRILIFMTETIEWFLLLNAVTGMYYGIEIGHPSKTLCIRLILYMNQ
jgi:hypothetical protein